MSEPIQKTAFYDAKGEALIPLWVLGFQSLFAVDKDGMMSANGRQYMTEGLRFPIPTQLPDDRAPIELDLGNASVTKMVPGAGVIIGKASMGKTLFLDTLAARNAHVTTIRYREPESDSLLYERDLVVRLVEALSSDKTVICIDSLRTTFYAAGGATGKGGVNMGIFEIMTAYDILAKVYGKVIIFALNPTSTDNDAIEYYLEAARGSVAHTLEAVKPLLVKLSSRGTSEKNDRGWANVAYSAVSKEESKKTRVRPEYRRLEEEGIADLYQINSK